MTRTVLLGALLLGLTLPAGANAASSFTIRTSDGVVTRIGALDLRQGGTLGQAMRVFGRPSRTDPVGDGSDACHVTWSRLRLEVVFANFGLANACTRGGGRFQTATIRGSRFRTARGVRVGSRSSTIPVKHREATFVRGSWWIATHPVPFSAGDEPQPTIRALVRAGRVHALSLWVGAAGD